MTTGMEETNFSGCDGVSLPGECSLMEKNSLISDHKAEKCLRHRTDANIHRS